MLQPHLVLSRGSVARRGGLAVLQLDPGLGVDLRLTRPRVLDAFRGTHAGGGREGGAGGAVRRAGTGTGTQEGAREYAGAADFYTPRAAENGGPDYYAQHSGHIVCLDCLTGIHEP